MSKFSVALAFIWLNLFVLNQVHAISCDNGCAPLVIQDKTAVTALPVIYSDPAGDSTGMVDIVEIAAGSTSSELLLEMTFTPSTVMAETSTGILLDLDQNFTTGEPTSAIWFALPTQTIGCENLLSIASDLVEVRTCEFPTSVLTTVIPTIDNNRLSFSIPLHVLNDDGNLNLALSTGNEDGPQDWAPEVGHATVSIISNYSLYMPIIIRP